MVKKLGLIAFPAFALLLAFQVGAVKGQTLVKDGLVSHWSFDSSDVQGDIADDVWGNNDGTLIGDPKLVAGKVGDALEFDGQDDFVDVGHPADGSLDFGVDIDFTMAAWINVSEVPPDQYTIISKGDRGDSARILFKVKANLAYITLANEPGGGQKPDFSSVTPVVDGEWHYVALVAERETATRIYVDGVLDAEGVGSDATDVNTESPLNIGRSYQDGADARRYFSGFIDEVSIYNKALTDEEMEQNYRAQGLAVKPSIEKLAVTWGMLKKLH